MKKAIKEALEALNKWEKRKSWQSEFAGPHTTEEEDKAFNIIIKLLKIVRSQNGR